MKVSIIMPTYKRQHVLPRAVNSILSQSYQNWELIIVNNEAISRLPTFDDPRILIFLHAQKKGAAYARNAGIPHATGELICFFDDDDEMLPGYLEKMAEPFQNPAVAIVRCGLVRAEHLHNPGEKDFSYATPEVWMRREYATPTWPSGTYLQDQHYFSGIVENNRWGLGQIVQLGEVLVRVHEDSKGGIREGAA